MKIAVVSPCSVDGLVPNLPERVDHDHPAELIRDLVDGYLERGHSVEVFRFNRLVSKVERYESAKVSVTLIPRRTRGYQLAPGFWRQERHAMSKAILASKPDVIHAHWTYEYAVAVIQTGLPSLITAHDVPSRLFKLMRPRYFWWPRLAQGYYVARKALRMTAQSPYTLACWKKEMYRTGPIDFVPNPIDQAVLDLFGSPRQPGPYPRFSASAMGFDQRKNTTTLLRAFAIVREAFPGATLTLFGHGHGPQEPGFLWAEDHGLTSGVAFKGQTDRRLMLKELSQCCDAFIHPAREESFGMVIAEAMALGIPVVAGKEAGAVPWLLDEGRAGILTDIESSDALATAMIEVLDRPGLGLVGRARILENFTSSKIVESYISILKEIASHPSCQNGMEDSV